MLWTWRYTTEGALYTNLSNVYSKIEFVAKKPFYVHSNCTRVKSIILTYVQVFDFI